MQFLNVVGARPNFMKMAPLIAEMIRRGHDQELVHTGQHYDPNMAGSFFADLGLPEPDFSFDVRGGTHAEQTANVMVKFEKVCDVAKPDLVVVVGDVNSTLACSIVSAKMGIPFAHVESGLRSGDMTMPEEINRVLTDRIADILLTPSRDADENLLAEGIAADRTHFVGNIMIDSLFKNIDRAANSTIVTDLGLSAHEYGVLTLHRPSNVDNPANLLGIMGAIHDIARKLPIVFSCHPRTAASLGKLAGYQQLAATGTVHVIEPTAYLDFVRLVSDSRLVLTDSGGLQEETTALGIPCLTIRENTERPITISEGTNTLVGTDPKKIREEAARALAQDGQSAGAPEYWDGQTAARIVDVFERWSLKRSK